MKKILSTIVIASSLSLTQAAEHIVLNQADDLHSKQNYGSLQKVARSSTPALNVSYKVVNQGHGTSTTYVYVGHVLNSF